MLFSPAATLLTLPSFSTGSVCMAERLALPTSDHGVAGLNPAGGEILPEPKRRFIAQSLSCSSFHRLEMSEILLKGHKTLTRPSIHPSLHLPGCWSSFSELASGTVSWWHISEDSAIWLLHASEFGAALCHKTRGIPYISLSFWNWK